MKRATSVAGAAWDRDWAKVRLLVKQGKDVNDELVPLKRTALHHVAWCGNVDICSFLLSQGANVSQKEEYGRTPLHEAAYGRNADICQLLVDYGAGVTSVTEGGETPLVIAVKSRAPLSVLRVLATNDSVNVADHHGNCPLHIAAEEGDIQIVQLLMDCGADISALNKLGQTPLHSAACGKKDCPELCSILLKHNARIDAEDIDGKRPLQHAYEKRHTATANLLSSHGPDGTVLNENQGTSLPQENNAKSLAWDQLPVFIEKQLPDDQTLADAGVTDATIPNVVCCPRGVTSTGADADNQIEQVKPVATLEMTVGLEGGHNSSGTLSVFVPDGALNKSVNMKMHKYIDERLLPPCNSVNDGYILSPLYNFEPHGLTFSKHVQVQFPPPVDSKGWQLSLMRAMCDTSASSQLWQPEAIVTIDSDLHQVNVEDGDSDYDLVTGTLSVTHFCWLWWLGKPVDIFMASKSMLFSVFGHKERPSLNIWILTIHCHDNCHELFEQIKNDEFMLMPKRQLLCLKKEMKMKFKGNIKYSVGRGDWKATSDLPAVPAAQFWHYWTCVDKKFQITVEFEHGDDHRSNKCIVDITQDDEATDLEMSPGLVQDDPLCKKEGVSQDTQQSLTAKANKIITEDDIVKIADKVSGYWKRLVLHLAPKLFFNKIEIIERENRDDVYMQAIAALRQWANEFGSTANQTEMIRAMCAIGCRSQAAIVFSDDLVKNVCPLK